MFIKIKNYVGYFNFRFKNYLFHIDATSRKNMIEEKFQSSI